MDLSTFDIARMKALKEYASLEFELCLLLKGIMQVEAQIASAIFYQISNTRTRYAIMGSMLDIRHPDTFKKAWPKLESWLTPCDSARNHIIHWGQERRIVAYPVPLTPGARELFRQDWSYETKETEILTNNVRRWRASGSPAAGYTEKKLEEVRQQFETMKHIINRFNLTVHFPDKWPWTDIFQQPPAHRTPAEFLSSLNDRGFPARLGSLSELDHPDDDES